MSLFEVKEVDRRFYEERIKDFVPDKFIDIHTHIRLKHLSTRRKRRKKWSHLVVDENSMEQLIESFELMFPGKEVIPLLFSSASRLDDFDAVNQYVEECYKKYNYPALIYAPPWWSGEEFEEKIKKGGFLGCKVYLTLAPKYIPEDEIRIYDFLPHHFLEVLDRNGWMAMLHIPRSARLRDKVNIAQMLEIEQKYPNARIIIAHVGRAYCVEDVGDAVDILAKETKNMLFEISANTNQWLFEQIIEKIGPKRILYGSDLPAFRMRARRICENGVYINLVPKGLYGDVSFDVHLREVEGEEAESLTFLLYEEIDAFRRAAENTGLTRQDIEDIFYNNAKELIDSIKR